MRVQGVRVQGVRVQGVRVQGSGFRVQGRIACLGIGQALPVGNDVEADMAGDDDLRLHDPIFFLGPAKGKPPLSKLAKSPRVGRSGSR